MLYTSVHNEKIKEMNKLKTKKYRDQTGLFLIEGMHLVEEAYKHGYLKEVFLKEDTAFTIEVPSSYVSQSVMKFLSDLESPPEVIGVCYKQKDAKLGNRIVILEDVQDPGNIGTIVRSAVAFHADTIVLTEGCADIYSTKVVRASQGMLFSVSILQNQLEEIIPQIKEKGLPIYATKVNGGNDVKKIEKTGKFAIIMGNEGKGVSKEAIEMSDTYLYIPMSPLCESLNVGVATSILLYELDKEA
ncbi:MAG: RNA methyltransferase [Bacilli bacterium]|nr:RNA methyltransferase [Bacilli bacterium]